MPRITTFHDAQGARKIESINVSGSFLNMHRIAEMIIQRANIKVDKPFFQFECDGIISGIHSTETALSMCALVGHPQRGRYDNWE